MTLEHTVVSKKNEVLPLASSLKLIPLVKSKTVLEAKLIMTN